MSSSPSMSSGSLPSEAAIPAPRLASMRTRRRDLFELILGLSGILSVIWTPRPFQRYLFFASAVFLAAVIWLRFHSWAAMGLRRTNLVRSLWVAAAAAVLACAMVLAASHLHTLHPLHGGTRTLLRNYWGYAVWALLQQILLQDFFLGRVLRLIPASRAAAVWATASIFALVHLPNPVLTPITLLWGLIACSLFLHYRNLVPLAIAHAILGVTLAFTIPAPVLRNMRVGLGYLTWPATHPARPGRMQTPFRPVRHRSQADHRVSTHAWVTAEDATLRSARHALP